VYWHPGIVWRITRIEVLNSIQWGLIKRNEVTCVATNLEGINVTDRDVRAQRYTRYLRDVRYRIHAELEEAPNPFKALQIFDRRSKDGLSYRQPYLGMSEFVGHYSLPTDRQPIDVSEDLGRMFYGWDRTDQENKRALYFHAHMHKGVVEVDLNVSTQVTDETSWVHNPLGALYGYYQRRLADKKSTIARPGWTWKKVPFVCVLDDRGRFIQWESTVEGTGKDRSYKEFLIPQSIQRSRNINAELLCDHVGYVLGLPKDETPKAKVWAVQQHAAYVQRLGCLRNIPAIQLIERFVTQEDVLQQVAQDPNWTEIARSIPWIVFRVGGQYVLDLPGVREQIDGELHREANEVKQCAITGEEQAVARLHYPLKGVAGASPMGSRLVSCNSDAFRMWNQPNGGAQISEKAMFAYVTAANELLAHGSNQKCCIGDLTMIFWAKRATILEKEWADFFYKSQIQGDPRIGTDALRSMLMALDDGQYVDCETDNEFYILGLLPNRSRLAVAFWRSGTARECLQELRQHYEDIKIRDPYGRSAYYAPYRLIRETVCGGLSTPQKVKNKMNKIQGWVTDFTVAAFSGTPYPQAIYSAALQALRTGRKTPEGTRTHNIPEALAIAKAYINRQMRREQREELPMEMSLDKDNPSVAYQLGRLLAVLDECQRKALGRKINKSIVDRFLRMASTTPHLAFGRLLQMQEIYLQKMDVATGCIYRNRINAILKYVKDFPTYFSVMDQGRFFLGFSHQSQHRQTVGQRAKRKDA
jgi:CRISPR-associated protein Csd1